MRFRMTSSEFRKAMDGIGLAILLLGFGFCAVPLVAALTPIQELRADSTLTLAFQGLVLLALGGCLRLLVRIDKRLEGR